MVPASPSQSPATRAQDPGTASLRRSWKRALLLGLSFGVGYGITHRLANLDVVVGWSGQQLFGVKTFPGTGLEGMRRTFGADARGIRADLDLLDLERQKQKDEAETRARREEIEERERRERQQESQAADQGAPQAPPVSGPEPSPQTPAEPDPLPTPPVEPIPEAPPPPEAGVTPGRRP